MVARAFRSAHTFAVAARRSRRHSSYFVREMDIPRPAQRRAGRVGLRWRDDSVKLSDIVDHAVHQRSKRFHGVGGSLLVRGRNATSTIYFAGRIRDARSFAPAVHFAVLLGGQLSVLLRNACGVGGVGLPLHVVNLLVLVLQSDLGLLHLQAASTSVAVVAATIAVRAGCTTIGVLGGVSHASTVTVTSATTSENLCLPLLSGGGGSGFRVLQLRIASFPGFGAGERFESP